MSRAPCVPICQNNQWAISTPGHVQTAAGSIALKGAGYGIEAIRADGNDVLAVVHAVKYAADKARRAVGAGHSAILDAVFATPQERAAAAASAEILGVPFHGLFLEADLDTRLARLSARGHDPSDADAAVARIQQSYDLGTLDWTRIDASGTPEETLARARNAVNP